ncbi:hypothetical protein [Paenibacillus sp.]|uniref:hypothetical protein n=1 Tax=Paenibacillus sp. TaxID=58172 RepID=UPI002D62719D|nr:hypothetical protein [Paenibacillus sp.]HZG86229.1 hypothetical protein [Paenibacillus sp.]
MKRNKPMSFDDLLLELKGQKANQNNPENVGIHDLFNKRFMERYSKSETFAEFLEKGNFQAETLEDIANIHEELWDRYVARETTFSNWQAMLQAAKAEQGKA